MKALIQRVSQAGVTVAGEAVGRIPRGILLLLGVERGDGADEVSRLCQKVVNYRIFPDDQGRMNLSLGDIQGHLLVVPQFTLAADTGSGTRPGFSRAAPPDQAQALFQQFVQQSRELLGNEHVQSGRFGADMKVDLTNDGPVTFLLQSGDSV